LFCKRLGGAEVASLEDYWEDRAEADLKYQEAQTSNQTAQAQANLAAAQSQVAQGDSDLENARLNFEPLQGLYRQGIESAQSHDQAQTAYASAQAHADYATRRFDEFPELKKRPSKTGS
jgi:multidrug resistance efflux pump